MKYHPDRGGDAKKFQEINEAYEILSDPNRKAQYDMGGQRGFGQGFHGDPFGNAGFGHNPFDDLLKILVNY